MIVCFQTASNSYIGPDPPMSLFHFPFIIFSFENKHLQNLPSIPDMVLN